MTELLVNYFAEGSVNMNFGDKILEARKKKGLTQKELGVLLHVSDKVISKWETGRALPDLDMFREISKVLDIDVSEFFKKVDLKPNTSKLVYDTVILNYVKYILINMFAVILGIIIYNSGYNIANGNTYFNVTVFQTFKLIKDLICIISVVAQIVFLINFIIVSKSQVSFYRRRNLIICIVLTTIYAILFFVTIGLGNFIYVQ